MIDVKIDGTIPHILKTFWGHIMVSKVPQAEPEHLNGQNTEKTNFFFDKTK